MPEAVAGAIGGFASTTAPIVLVGFSGGWKPVGAILQGLLKRGDGSERVIGIQLLDAVYEDWFCRYAFVEKWIGAKGKQTVLVSIFSSTTDCGAKAGNEHLLRTLRPKEIPKPSSDWSLLPNPLPAGTIAFFEMSTSHPDIPRDGPPTNPIASFLSLLGDRVSAPLLTG